MSPEEGPRAGGGSDGTAAVAPGPGAGGRLRGITASSVATALLTRYALLVVFGLTIVVFSLLEPDAFPTLRNARSILTQMAPLAIVAAGLTVVLVMWDFDLSIGAMIGLGGALAIVMMSEYGVAWQVAILASLGTGLVVGATSGFLIAYLGGSSFIITLAMGTVLIGVEFLFTGQETIYGGVAPQYADLGQSSPLLGLNAQVWIAAGVALLIYLLLDKMEIGRYMYAIGGNPEAARLSGLRTREIRLSGYVIVAVCAAIAGILLTAQAAASSPTQGTPFLLPAFAAVFLGSAVFRLGEFNVLGTVVGVLFIGVIRTGLTMVGVETAVTNIVEGAILILAVLLSRLGQRVT